MIGAMRKMLLGIGLAAPFVAAGLDTVVAAEAQLRPPQRVMSLNQCSDQLLLSLLPLERITSVTYLARQLTNSYYAAAASRVRINYGLAEEVLAQKPDLVIVGLYSNFALRPILKRTEIPLIELPPANNFEQIRETTRMVARAVGAVAEGEALLGKMDATLAQLAATAPARPVLVAGWSDAGTVPGKATLFDAILTAAGGVNVAAAWTGETSGTFDVEQILEARPEILAFGDWTIATPGLRAEQLRHSALQRFYAGRQIVYPSSLFLCGVPQSADAAVLLRRAMLTIAGPR
jgi:iron complex transport system substrate-binding protein